MRHQQGSPMPGLPLRSSKGAPLRGAPVSEPLRPPAPSPLGGRRGSREKRGSTNKGGLQEGPMQGPYLCDLRHMPLTWVNTRPLRILQDTRMGPLGVRNRPDWCRFVRGQGIRGGGGELAIPGSSCPSWAIPPEIGLCTASVLPPRAHARETRAHTGAGARSHGLMPSCAERTGAARRMRVQDAITGCPQTGLGATYAGDHGPGVSE